MNLKFMTDGILQNEMMSNFQLTNYGTIIIDEAHRVSPVGRAYKNVLDVFDVFCKF